jgi:hypothetical protein
MGTKSHKAFAKELRKHVSAEDGMTNVMVNKLARAFCSKKYKGLYMPHELAKKRKTVFARSPFSTIVNVGRHFVVILGFDKTIMYLDSYGLPCTEKKTEAFLRSFPSKAVFYNNKRIQGSQSMFCGLYAVLFATYFDRPRSFSLRFKTRVGKRGKANEELCLQYLSRLVINTTKRTSK